MTDTTLVDLVITDMIVPTRADASDGAEFRAMVELGNRSAELDAGIDDLSDTPEQVLPGWLDQTDRLRRGFIARRGGEIVGAAVLTTASAAGTTAAELELMVVPPHWQTGVGRALLERTEQEANALGRTVLHLWTLHPTTRTDGMLSPATGWGEVAPTSLSELLAASGYALEQVERNSVLLLDGPLEMAEQRLAEATAFAGPEYRVVAWTLPTPPEFRSGYGGVIARMATDVPSGDLEIDEEVWDDGRVARRDATLLAGGQTMSVAAVIHEPTGDMVAFNELLIGADRTGVTHQWGTLVTKEHRGKRLGTIVKCANLLRWRDVAPESPKISTFNAEENRPMLDINEAIGFVPASYAGAWQKRLR
ncbi:MULTISPECIES: GNAT family N-acetyltransferase [unclassified Microbacterium]|uniref:GNAT family N-acetyltransferase n=1 Tax=unclassified Microbacterium TaxID=2609290 RepID=UPI001DF98EFA|nr:MULTISPECIES: GNAT family N-acetyltransferase [unclassified Microbacterium]CAH0181345.1 Mycothiol acetyltransferase [Microbacterium sp. Bi121]HWK77515.1 GNAT family N-acetyltransferase [Microbacterium sp.]